MISGLYPAAGCSAEWIMKTYRAFSNHADIMKNPIIRMLLSVSRVMNTMSL